MASDCSSERGCEEICHQILGPMGKYDPSRNWTTGDRHIPVEEEPVGSTQERQVQRRVWGAPIAGNRCVALPSFLLRQEGRNLLLKPLPFAPCRGSQKLHLASIQIPNQQEHNMEIWEGQKRSSGGTKEEVVGRWRKDKDGRVHHITSPLPCFSLLSPTRLRALICINPAGYVCLLSYNFLYCSYHLGFGYEVFGLGVWIYRDGHVILQVHIYTLFWLKKHELYLDLRRLLYGFV